MDDAVQKQNDLPGCLYVVATPIGNSADLSPRGRKVLEEADLIAAEDTRRSMVLLNKLGIRNRLVSNHKYNEHGKAKRFLQEMMAGKSVAIITDAGTPCISDPGNELIRAAIDAEIKVVGIPGCCAAVNALSVSGFDLRSFCFLGFFPRENAERMRLLDTMRRDQMTSVFVFYESPLRIMEMIDFLIRENAQCSLCVTGISFFRKGIMTRGNTPSSLPWRMSTAISGKKSLFLRKRCLLTLWYAVRIPDRLFRRYWPTGTIHTAKTN